MSEQRQERPGKGAPGVPDDAAARETREAQEAHGGSMAPGLVDDTGHPVGSDPSRVAGEDSAGA
ncbi:hypothetical protein NCC78_30745 [Micromonospora phytophila]|uniref:hypothetical protein n=1 Tax=Micromonospora phytophila TaxID=709888 RepID=UPI00202E916F|nr:hypothetical protein [Micromonospora phytophila]MCM0679016.1 hypothetical protein [Micromonospora phytophila]